ncbi:MAG: GNAT family N-acetyltransferase, partial [Candidatus Bipolaricaulis sp.]|nr:GNAT family N-acetyltransferase [Candidatus Bipolaricaulis sp.]
MNANCAYELTTWNTDKVVSLFSGLRPEPLHLRSLLAGRSPGRVFVDRMDRPTAAAVLGGEGCYLGGVPSDGFLGAINALLPRDRCTAVFFSPDLDPRAVDAIVDGLYMTRAVRWHGRLAAVAVDRIERTDGVRIRPVDRAVLHGELAQADDLRKTILSEWKTEALFLEFGVGAIAVVDDRIVGWSTSDYVVDGRCEIGVWVAKDWRLRGIGTAAAADAARQAFVRGAREVGWHCWANNLGSIGVAANVGFAPTGRYEILFNHWAAGNIEDMTEDEYRAFAVEYERQFTVRPPRESGYPHVVAATAWALAGEGEKCREHIRTAINIGWLCGIAQLRALWPELLASQAIWENP